MRSLFLIGFLLFVGGAHAAINNMGKEFMLCFMDNLVSSSGPSFDIEVFITTTSNTDAQVNVTTPLFDAAWLGQATVSRGNIETLQIPAAIRGESTKIDGLGVHFTSTEDITVYAVNKEKFSTDAFVAYPVDAVGNDYIAVTSVLTPEIMVAGITDGTEVTFQFSTSYTESFTYQASTYTGGDTLTVTLDRYQTFHIYSDSGDLSGTRITATHPISAFSGNFKTTVLDTMTQQTSDHLVEQLVPTQSWGKKFVTFPSPERVIGDFVRIFAAVDDTEYSFGGANFSLQANAYNIHNVPSDEYNWVISTKGIQVAVYSKTLGLTSTNDGVNGGDPAISICAPVELYHADYTWSTVTTTVGDFNNYIIVVSEKSYIDDLVLDDNNMTASWVDVIGNSDYVGTVVDVTPGSHNLYNRVPAHPFMGIAYGNAQYNSYAYAAGTRLASINLPCTPTSSVAGDGEDNDCDGMIDEETNNGIDDDGDGSIDEDLAIAPRVNGQWSDWAAWGSCSAVCGSQSGTKTRTRNCDNPAPANFGLDCVGSGTETDACTGPSTPCPINGGWADWGVWSTCGVTCGSGDQSRNRSCDNPPAQHGGNDCAGSGTESIVCTISSYCLPSFYGNIDQGCNNVTQFGCATGGIQCIDIAFRCDGQIDCDDATDESHFFTGCAKCSDKSSSAHVYGSLLHIGLCIAMMYMFKTVSY